MAIKRDYHHVLAVLTIGVFMVFQAGCALKVGSYRMESPQGEGAETKLRIEGEVASSKFLNNHLDVFGVAGWSQIDSSGELETANQFGVPMGTLSAAELNLIDCGLGVHLYPFNKLCNGSLTPYIGGGAGYFWSRTTERGAGKKIGQGAGFTLHEIVESGENIADGFFPFILGGLRLGFGQSEEFSPFVLIEGRYDFNKEDGDFDYSGSIISAGFGFDW